MMSKGTVYRFDGVNDAIIVTDSADVLNIFDGGGFISADIYPISDGESDAGRILDKRAGGSGWSLFTVTDDGSNCAIRFFLNATGNANYVSAVSIPLNTWSHILIAYNASDLTTAPVLYVNRVAVAWVTATAGTGTRTSDAGENIGIGADNLSANTFDGSIGEVMLSTSPPPPPKSKTSSQAISRLSGSMGVRRIY